MGGFQVPNFAASDSRSSSSMASLPQLGASNAPAPGPGFPTGSLNGVNEPYGGYSYASGGALPGQNKIQNQPTIDPALTNQLLGFLSGNVGKGLSAFNQSVDLPSGGKTQSGQLSAQMNPILQQLQQFMTGKC